MNYRYNCGDEVIRVGVWNDDFHTTVIVTDNKTKADWKRLYGNLHPEKWKKEKRE